MVSQIPLSEICWQMQQFFIVMTVFSHVLKRSDVAVGADF